MNILVSLNDSVEYRHPLLHLHLYLFCAWRERRDLMCDVCVALEVPAATPRWTDASDYAQPRRASSAQPFSSSLSSPFGHGQCVVERGRSVSHPLVQAAKQELPATINKN